MTHTRWGHNVNIHVANAARVGLAYRRHVCLVQLIHALRWCCVQWSPGWKELSISTFQSHMASSPPRSSTHSLWGRVKAVLAILKADGYWTEEKLCAKPTVHLKYLTRWLVNRRSVLQLNKYMISFQTVVLLSSVSWLKKKNKLCSRVDRPACMLIFWLGAQLPRKPDFLPQLIKTQWSSLWEVNEMRG